MQQLFIICLVIWSSTCFTLNTAIETFGESAPAKPKHINFPISSNSYNSYSEDEHVRRVVRKCFLKRKSSKMKNKEKMLDRQEDLDAIKRLIAIGKTKQRSIKEPLDWMWMRNRESGERKIVEDLKIRRFERGSRVKDKASGSHQNAAREASKVSRRRRNRVPDLKQIGAIAGKTKAVGKQIIPDPRRVKTEVRKLTSNQNEAEQVKGDIKLANSPEQSSAGIPGALESIQYDGSPNFTMPGSEPISRIEASLQHKESKNKLEIGDDEQNSISGQPSSSRDELLDSKHAEQQVPEQHQQSQVMKTDMQDEKPANLEKQVRSKEERPLKGGQVACEISHDSANPQNTNDQNTICSAEDQDKVDKKILSQEKKFVVTNFRKYVMNFLCPHCGGEISVSRGRTKGIFNVRDDVRVHKSDADMIKPPYDSSWPPKDQTPKKDKRSKSKM